DLNPGFAVADDEPVIADAAAEIPNGDRAAEVRQPTDDNAAAQRLEGVAGDGAGIVDAAGEGRDHDGRVRTQRRAGDRNAGGRGRDQAAIAAAAAERSDGERVAADRDTAEQNTVASGADGAGIGDAAGEGRNRQRRVGAGRLAAHLNAVLGVADDQAAGRIADTADEGRHGDRRAAAR